MHDNFTVLVKESYKNGEVKALVQRNRGLIAVKEVTKIQPFNSEVHVTRPELPRSPYMKSTYIWRVTVTQNRRGIKVLSFSFLKFK